MSIRICASPACCVTFTGDELMCPTHDRQAVAEPVKKKRRKRRHWKPRETGVARAVDLELYRTVFGYEAPERHL